MLRTAILALALASATLTGPALALSTSDDPADAYLGRPYYCVPRLVFIRGNADRPYMELVYYTPARPPYYNIPPQSVLVPYFGPAGVQGAPCQHLLPERAVAAP